MTATATSDPNSELDDDDFRDILAHTRTFVRDVVVPRELEIGERTRFRPTSGQAAEMGLFGYAIPHEWGGLGLDLTQDVELAMEFGYTSLALRSMFGTSNGIAGQVLVDFGTDGSAEAVARGSGRGRCRGRRSR